MAAPKVDHCIVCNGLKPAWDIIGFQGLLPHELKIKRWDVPTTLAFLFVVSGLRNLTGPGGVQASLLGPNGQTIATSPVMTGNFNGREDKGSFGFIFESLLLPGQGEYSVALTLNGQEIYQGELKISSPTSRDLNISSN